MPCQGGCESTAERYVREEKASLVASSQKLKVENDKLTALLCSTCRVLQEKEYDFDKNPELSRFWDEHKKQDDKRVREEAKRRLEISRCVELSEKAFKDLTQEDKKLLKKHKFLD